MHLIMVQLITLNLLKSLNFSISQLFFHGNCSCIFESFLIIKKLHHIHYNPSHNEHNSLVYCITFKRDIYELPFERSFLIKY